MVWHLRYVGYADSRVYVAGTFAFVVAPTEPAEHRYPHCTIYVDVTGFIYVTLRTLITQLLPVAGRSHSLPHSAAVGGGLVDCYNLRYRWTVARTPFTFPVAGWTLPTLIPGCCWLTLWRIYVVRLLRTLLRYGPEPALFTTFHAVWLIYHVWCDCVVVPVTIAAGR